MQAYLEVKANKGSAGIDEETLSTFEKDLKNNLYRIWNRMSSGSYFPPSVKAVPIPKKTGGTRILGVPTVSDRVAQMVVKKILEPLLEPIFDENSFGYRPNRSAHDALTITRKRCWKYDWVVEFDIKGMFDNIRHTLLIKALEKHCDSKWIIMYVKRWLCAPLEDKDGKKTHRYKGTPQGGVISPLLANLFMHYAFDAWVRRELKEVPFCRYADDGLLHCKSQKQAEFVMKRLIKRFWDCGLEINLEKSKIIYCKDKNRKENYQEITFDFLGYTFRPRRCVNGKGEIHPNFLPAISNTSKKAITKEIRSWHLQLKNEKSLLDLSKMFNSKLIGWSNYYGKFYSSELDSIWKNFNRYLEKWVRRKHKRFAWHKRRARDYINCLARANPSLFINWKMGYFPGGKVVGAV
ncbi:group II intron reverse transcriptase/maturase [bacterium]